MTAYTHPEPNVDLVRAVQAAQTDAPLLAADAAAGRAAAPYDNGSAARRDFLSRVTERISQETVSG
jgi:hypothetical protein